MLFEGFGAGGESFIFQKPDEGLFFKISILFVKMSRAAVGIGLAEIQVRSLAWIPAKYERWSNVYWKPYDLVF